MVASGGADPRMREREGLPFLNGAPLFGGATQTHRHSNHGAGEDPESSSNPDPVSFAFAAKPKAAVTVTYRECLRNHAASVGGSVYDGCGEFMPAGEEGSLEALKCAACDCHRNFHRKETDGGVEGSHQFTAYRRSSPVAPLQLPAPPALTSPSMAHHSHGYHARHFSSLSIVPPMNVAYGGGGLAAAGTESSSEDLNLFGTPTPGSGGCFLGSSNHSSVKKRSRTKFTPLQKEKMMELAEKIGWKMQRQSDEEVERFCAEVGVKRQVFKVWMHNNKSTMNKSSKPLQFQTPSP